MSLVIGQSTAPNEVGVSGIAFPETAPGMVNIGVKGDGGTGIPLPVATGTAIGVFGTCAGVGVGVKGVNTANNANGFLGGFDPKFQNQAGVYGESAQQGVIGHATNDTGTGVFGDSTGGGFGIRGEAVSGTGVFGRSLGGGVGVFGESVGNDGVRATSISGNGLSARSTSSAALFAESVNSFGVVGIAHIQPGVSGNSDSSDGVRATSVSGNGLSARSTSSTAVFAASQTSNGVSAFGGGNGVGIFAQASARRSPAAGSNHVAAAFDGDVEVTGDIRLIGNGQDFAEDFDISGADEIEPGTVMVLNDDGALQACQDACDKRVAGVISGAGDLKPGIVLGRLEVANRRLPISLLGKVCCKVDASYSPIAVGDLLTTSPNSGHAMKVTDPVKAFGSVIGKAMRPLAEGCGIIPILIALQ